jgi:hypothetical protein
MNTAPPQKPGGHHTEEQTPVEIVIPDVGKAQG